MKPVFGASAFFLSSGSRRIFVCAFDWTPVWLVSRSIVPAISSLSIVFGSTTTVMSISSGRALRTVSVERSQFGLRLSGALLPGWRSDRMYGPDDHGLSVPYLAPVSWACGTGPAVGMASRYGKSANGAASLKTIVLSSGVVMDFRPSALLSLYGPA